MPDLPRGLLLLTAALAGVLLVVAAAAGDAREVAFPYNPRPLEPRLAIGPGQEGCQTRIPGARPFDRVEMVVETSVPPGPPLEVTVRDAPGRPPRAIGRARGGAAGNGLRTATFPRLLEPARPPAVCVRNLGAAPVALYADEASANSSRFEVDGRTLDGDAAIAFRRTDAPALLGQLPAVFERAARFRPDGIVPVVYWVGAAVVALLVPLLLVRAVRRASDGEARMRGPGA